MKLYIENDMKYQDNVDKLKSDLHLNTVSCVFIKKVFLTVR